MGLGGSLNFQWCPEALQALIAPNSDLTGNLALGHFPNTLKVFFFACNRMTDTIEFANMPDSMREFKVQANQFHGRLDLKVHSVSEIGLSRNQFGGTFNLELFSADILMFNISGNNFWGL